MTTDQRLIEDYIPIEAISEEARREKSIRKGHISTLHLWWARRPLVASRAAVYGALAPAPTGKKAAKEAADFVAALCTYPGPRDAIKQAQRHILEAHAERLTAERATQTSEVLETSEVLNREVLNRVTVEDIVAGRAPRPRVLDMFAGGGAIPLEALRLGCEAYALDLNPVAHLIQLCTLVYPQQFGAPDPAAVGCLPSPSEGGVGGGGWAGLAAEVEHWGQWVLAKVKAEIGDLYPPIPDPQSPIANPPSSQPAQLSLDMTLQETREGYDARAGMLTPVAYLWTRTVRCKNPACGGTVPLARQTWLAKKKGRYLALKPDAEANRDRPPGEKTVRYHVVEATTEKGLGFDPAAGSRGGNIACPFCGTVADSAYVKAEGQAGQIEVQPMVVVCTKSNERGKFYLTVGQVPSSIWPNDKAIWQQIHNIEVETVDHHIGPLTIPNEPLPSVDARGAFFVKLYGYEKWGQFFSPRQLLVLFSFSKHVRAAHKNMLEEGYSEENAKAVTTYLGLLSSRTADWNSSMTHWTPQGEKLGPTFTRMALPMVWDFVEINPLVKVSGNAVEALERMVEAIRSFVTTGRTVGRVSRGSATALPFEDGILDAIVTDPPYYDNVPYSDLSDFFFVWLKRSIGFLYPEHFSSLLTPKKKEAIMDAGRHKRDKDAAKDFYEQMMAEAFAEAARTLKSGAPLVIVYAHKTTLGWATLVDALRTAGFIVTEAWPMDTERPGRPRAYDSAALASSIFLVARRRESNDAGAYEQDVQPELRRIVRERLERLWAQGVTGADLVIACVGAGLRAFTRFARVEYANGEPVPADSFLGEVEGAVLEGLLEKLFGVSSAGVGSVDAATRFYVLWRFAYRHATIDAGEAIVFAYPQHVELDGPNGLSSGGNPLVEKIKGKYRLRDFTERGEDEDLGLPSPPAPLPGGEGSRGKSPSPFGRGVRGEGRAPLIDVLHRLLWLVENRPALIQAYLDESRPDLERLRLVAQTLAGQTLAGNGSNGGRSLVVARGAEAAALRKLTTNWRSLIEAHRGRLV